LIIIRWSKPCKMCMTTIAGLGNCRMIKYWWFIGYLLTIVGANAAITAIGLVPVGFGLLAPAGVYVAGLGFSLRDGLQESGGKRWVVAGIAVGALLSVGFGGQLALASGIAFLFSELADFAAYTPLKARGQTLLAIALSNTVGLIADSVLFLWIAFGSLAVLPGLIVGKVWMTVLAVVVVFVWQRYYKKVVQ